MRRPGKAAGPRRRRPGIAPVAALLAALAVATVSPPARADLDRLRVCADPNNLPFSNDRGQGFENKLAELVARELGKPVSYTWWAQRRGFIRNTLKTGLCDVVMGVPAELDMVATTLPYYRSTYVFVSRTDRGLDLQSIKDPRLRRLAIGVHLIGDDGANTPPADALGREGIVNNLVGYMIYGDYRQANPLARLIEGVERGDIDIAAAWGPLAGYFAGKSAVPLTLAPITETAEFAPLRFEYDIAMGVRHGDDVLRDRLNRIIAEKRPEIERLLKRYGVPLVPGSRKPGSAVLRDIDD